LWHPKPEIGFGGVQVFRGSNEINMDAKGRLAVPSRYRDALLTAAEGQLVATIDFEDPCLIIYPLPAWRDIEVQLARLPTFNPDARRVQRLLIGHARELELDGSGRLLIPPELRAYAGLEKAVVLVGQVHRFELWSAEHWNASREQWLAAAAGGQSLPAELQNLSL
jgi:MraZ protein